MMTFARENSLLARLNLIDQKDVGSIALAVTRLLNHEDWIFRNQSIDDSNHMAEVDRNFFRRLEKKEAAHGIKNGGPPILT